MAKTEPDDQFRPTPGLAARLTVLARRHHGYVTRAELNAAGLSDPAIYARVRSGRLHRRHRGVYAIGYPRTEPIALAAAAVLAGGPGSALSHDSAAALWGLRRDWPDPPEVTVARDRRPGGVAVHRSQALSPRDVRRHHGIPTTSAARALLDITPRLSDRELARAVSDARIGRRAYPDELLELTARLPTHVGATRLRAQITGTDGLTRSDFERDFSTFVRRHELPRPRFGVHVAGCEVDALFAAQRLIVECDGWEFHRDRVHFESDRARDAATLAAGYATIRLTAAMLAPDAEAATAQRLRTILAQRARTIAAEQQVASARGTSAAGTPASEG